ncbi:MAG: hypothetical protein HY075_07605 [Deltaproteobacteria bacterium]|nr:hypothetical protein [Deltaproteobacteria bacterium]
MSRRRKADAAANARAYDLTAPTPPQVALPAWLPRVFDRFCRSLSRTLTATFHQHARVALISSDGLRFDDLVAGFPWPSCAGLAGDGALVIFDAKLVYRLVELSFGGAKGPQGKPRATPEPVEAFTPIELSVSALVMRQVLAELVAAWSEVGELRIAFTRCESNPKLIDVFHVGEVVVSTTFDLEIGGVRGVFCLALAERLVERRDGRRIA